MSKKGDATDAVLRYLTLQNRPYSANDVCQNLKDFSKASIQKALDELAASMKIKEKTYGKQKVYAPVQSDCNDQAAMDSMLAELDKNIAEKTSELLKLDETLKIAENELKSYAALMSTDQAAKSVKALNVDVDELENKLQVLTEGGITISAEDKLTVQKQHESSHKEYRKRKRICMDIANQILENYPKTKKAFFEEAGIEVDEDVTL